MKDEQYKEQLKLIDYIKNFSIHFDLLLRRYKRFKEVNVLGSTDIDVITYLDMIVVQLRAICIENERYRNNYTVQILLRRVGKDELAQRIDDMLNEDFYDGAMKITIRTALKIIADEFICHYDNFDGENLHKLSVADILMNRLRNPYEPKNLDYIMRILIECIGEGLAIKIGGN